MSYPERLEIQPLDKPPHATIRVPGSKSITNRALVLAALYGSRDGCELRGALQSEDTEVMVTCLRDLGFSVETNWAEDKIRVSGRNPETVIPVSDANLFVANSGTSMRFLTAMVSLGCGRYRLDGVPRMRQRPIEDLLIALRQLGVRDAYTEKHNGFPPVIVKASGLDGGTVRIKGDISSQFLSALMMVAPYARQPVHVEVVGPLVSEPYVAMTERMMAEFGAFVDSDWEGQSFSIAEWLDLSVKDCEIEPDASAASYVLAALLSPKARFPSPDWTPPVSRATFDLQIRCRRWAARWIGEICLKDRSK
jgi:3-phosphoshikimate 1-carboxyvinyltransferase